MIKRLEYTLTAGGSSKITDPQLAFGRVLRVQRSGTGYNRKRTGVSGSLNAIIAALGSREVYIGSVVNNFHLIPGNLVFKDRPQVQDELVIVLIDI